MSSKDIFTLCFHRNLIHVLDKIFSNVGAQTLISLYQASRTHKNIVSDNREARKIIMIWKKLIWRETKKRSLSLSTEDEMMVTCLAQKDQTLMFAGLTTSSSIFIWDLVRENIIGKIVVEEDFPSAISGIDFDEKYVVIIGYDKDSQVKDGRQQSVFCYCRKRKFLLTKFNPHKDIIKKIKIYKNLLFTISNDGTININNFDTIGEIPETVVRLDDHQDAVIDISLGSGFFVSLSADFQVLVWNLDSFDNVNKFSVAKYCSKIALSWPYVAVSGQNTVYLWNLKSNALLRKLEITKLNVINVMEFNFGGILVCDLSGKMILWSIKDVLDGHNDTEGRTHKTLDINDQDSDAFSTKLVTGAKFVTQTSMFAVDWNGRLTFWKF